MVIGVSLVTVMHLRHDLRYAFESRTATPMSVLSGSGDLTHLESGRFASVRGLPDRRDDLYIEARGDKTRESFFRLLASDPPVFVRAKDTARASVLSAEWTGRLRRFGEVSYALSLRDYFQKGVYTRRHLDVTSLRAALEAKAFTVTDRQGRTLTLDPSSPIEIEQLPDHYVLELLREKFPTLEDAQHEVERVTKPLGATLSGLAQDDPEVFQFATPLLENDVPKRNTLLEALSAAGVTFSLGHRQYSSELGKLVAKPEGLSITRPVQVSSPDRVIPWSQLAFVVVREPMRIDDQALVLTEGETPAGLVWVPLVVALLVALSLWNVWYLARPRRS